MDLSPNLLLNLQLSLNSYHFTFPSCRGRNIHFSFSKDNPKTCDLGSIPFYLLCNSFCFTNCFILVCLLSVYKQAWISILRTRPFILPSLQASLTAKLQTPQLVNRTRVTTIWVPTVSDHWASVFLIFTTNLEGIVPVLQMRKMTLKSDLPKHVKVAK